MSVKNTDTIICPKCGFSKEITIWSSVNVSLDPEMKQQLYDGKINYFKCDQCGLEDYLFTPFLYHDMEKKYCVQYYPAEYLKKSQFFEQFNPDGSIKLHEEVGFEVPAYMLNLHVVFDMNELVKFVLFRELLHNATAGKNEDNEQPSMN